MLQALLMVDPLSKIYRVSTVLFYKYGGANVAVKHFISHFSMFLPTKSTVILANGNTVHDQGIRVILCHFPNCLIIYSVGPVYYYRGQLSNTRSSGALKFYICFKRLHMRDVAYRWRQEIGE